MIHETTHYQTAEGLHFTITTDEDRPGNIRYIFTNFAHDPTVHPYGMVIRSTALAPPKTSWQPR